MSRHVFTYGSLMFPEVWSLVVAGHDRSIAATLAGHARHAIVGETYPGMVAEDGSQVRGVVHLDVDDADLVALDAFEGDDYVRREVTVIADDSTAWIAQTYVYRRIERLASTGWNPDAFAMQRFIETYCAARLPKAG